MIQVEAMLQQKLPHLQQHPWLHKPTVALLRSVLCERQIGAFAAQYPQLHGLEFVEHVLDFFNFTYTARDAEKDNIASQGRLIIVANHPIGSLDGLALLKLISEVRSDVKVLANDMLMAVKPLQELLIPVAVFGKQGERSSYRAMQQHLEADGALIIFPAGEVSRLSPVGVRDGKWYSGFVRLAQRTQTAILPVFVGAHNSALFYGASMLYKPLGTLLLVQEMFKQQQRHIKFRIGEVIPASALQHAEKQASVHDIAAVVRKHLYRIGHDRPGLLRTQRPVARAEPRQLLKRAMEACELIGETTDGQQIYHYRYQGNSTILRELGRLREIAFRAVDEGTGRRRDLDNYDTWYQHLLLWNPQDLEIAGAYRFGDSADIMAQHGIAGLYSHSLFRYGKAMEVYFSQGLELGRSFVQPRYWGKRSLEYLWQGIGALLRRQPNYRYLFGPVTLSGALPQLAKDAMVQFFSQQFSDTEQLAVGRTPYLPQQQPLPQPTGDYRQDFAQLKQYLAAMQVAIPTLYKQYADLCEPGGVHFLAFNVDNDFADAIDGLVMVDIAKLKASKRERYIEKRG
jgi:putative hemolysin